MMRTTASRRWNTAWNRFWMFPAAGALAASLASDWGGGVPDARVWLARAVVVAGGLLAGVLAARDTSAPRLAPALLAPVPILALAGLVMASGSESDSDLWLAGGIVVIALLLFDVPLALVFLLHRGRRDEHIFAPVATPVAMAQDGELEVATDFGRATTVVREYVYDDEGRSHLEADAKALGARGYERVSVEHTRPGSAQVGLELVVGAAGIPAGFSEAKIVATFRLRPGVEPRRPKKTYWT
jgi:hypothetical protein